jgi:hypothetical protein
LGVTVRAAIFPCACRREMRVLSPKHRPGSGPPHSLTTPGTPASCATVVLDVQGVIPRPQPAATAKLRMRIVRVTRRQYAAIGAGSRRQRRSEQSG